MPGDNGNAQNPQAIRKAPTSGEVVDRNAIVHRELHDEGPSAADIERFGDVTRRCPACGKEVYDDAEVCYHCGEAMNAPEHAKHADWRVVLVIVLVTLLLGGLVFGIKLW